MHGVFVSGTDTGIGKTCASAALLHALRARGLRASGMKPVASGCRATPQGLRNEDAEALLAASDPAPPYADCNPYALAEPIAPHIAARLAGVEIDIGVARAACARIAANADRVVVEGVGGWAVPFSAQSMQVDLVRALALPVVLVVGLRLGCLNHALLSHAAIAADGCVLAGWIANRIDPAMPFAESNLHALQARIDAPLLGVIEHAHAFDARVAARLLDVDAL
ncbi:MAG: dethiobiotin synthase [Lysobacteraceae bacterium]|nr:MAG: dethiobiotin synthase [Xanthomonadaceae bacterium]